MCCVQTHFLNTMAHFIDTHPAHASDPRRGAAPLRPISARIEPPLLLRYKRFSSVALEPPTLAATFVPMV